MIRCLYWRLHLSRLERDIPSWADEANNRVEKANMAGNFRQLVATVIAFS